MASRGSISKASQPHAEDSSKPHFDNLWDWLIQVGRQHPQATAVTSRHQPSSTLANLCVQSAQVPFVSWTWAELIKAAESLSAYLYSLNAREGDVCLFIGSNSIEFALCLWTAFRTGMTFATYNPTVHCRPSELEFLMSKLKPSVVMLETDELTSSTMHAMPAELKVGLVTRINTASLPRLWSCIGDIKQSPGCSAPLSVRKPEDAVYVQFTSGSTNVPKGCSMTVSNVKAEIDAYQSFASSHWARDTNYLATAPAHGAVGYLGVLNTWTAGGHVIYAGSSFDAQVVFDAICDHHATHLMLMPTYAQDLVRVAATMTHRGPESLKYILVAGDYASNELLQALQKALHAEHVVFSWGMSEGAPVFGWRKDDMPLDAHSRITSIGRVLPGSSAKVTIPGTKAPETLGNIGSLHIASNCTITSYVGGVNADDFYVEDGVTWFKTGDLAYMDDSLALFVVGRDKDVIKSDGQRIIPSMIEDFLSHTCQLEVSVSSALLHGKD